MKSEISHVCVCRMQVKVLQCEPNLNRHLNTMLTEKIMSHLKIICENLAPHVKFTCGPYKYSDVKKHMYTLIPNLLG